MDELNKDQKLDLLKQKGLIDNVDDFKTLTVKQIDFLIEKANSLKSETISEDDTETDDVVKRRKAEQELAKLKTTLKNKAVEMVELVR